MITYAALAVTGISAGILGSMVGLGGGMLFLPVLNLLMGYSLEMTVGTSLFATIFTSLSSFWGHYRAGHIYLKTGCIIGCGGLAGVLIGSFIFNNYFVGSLNSLKTCMGLWFLFLSFRMGQQAYHSLKGIHDPQRNPPFSPESTTALLIAGCFTGILAGILGIAGGVVMMPVLTFFFGLPLLQAVGTTFLAMLAITVSGGLIKMFHGFVVLESGLVLGLGAALGAQLGVFFSRFITPLMLKSLFSLLFLFIGVSYFL